MRSVYKYFKSLAVDAKKQKVAQILLATTSKIPKRRYLRKP